MAKILISTSSFGKEDPAPLEMCRNRHEIILNPHGRAVESAELLELAAGVEGMIAGTEKLDRKILQKLPLLKVISRCGSGMDNVDLVAARELGIEVYSTPFGPTLAVAELTVGFLLDLVRRISWMDREMRKGIWKKRMGNLLHGKRIGIVGFGKIGRKVAELLQPFEVSLAFCDVNPQITHPTIPRHSFAEILEWADIITIHRPAEKGEVLMGSAEIRKMRKHAFLINVSRGSLVDEKALYDALKEQHLSGAALDVFGKEPYEGPLLHLENVIVTPHIGSYAREARIKMEMEAAENLLHGLEAATSRKKQS